MSNRLFNASVKQFTKQHYLQSSDVVRCRQMSSESSVLRKSAAECQAEALNHQWSPFLKSSTLGMPCRCRTGHRQTLDAAISPRHPWIQNRHETCHVVMMCCLLYISSNATSIDSISGQPLKLSRSFAISQNALPRCIQGV